MRQTKTNTTQHPKTTNRSSTETNRTCTNEKGSTAFTLFLAQWRYHSGLVKPRSPPMLMWLSTCIKLSSKTSATSPSGTRFESGTIGVGSF